jgi:hypothetical protein
MCQLLATPAKVALLFAAAILSAAGAPAPASSQANLNERGAVSRPFITTKGTQLMEGDSVFKWASINTPGLHTNEDLEMYVLHPPTPFEQEDALASLAQLNARVTRQYVISMAPLDKPLRNRHISMNPRNEPIPPNWLPIPGTSSPQVFTNSLPFELYSLLMWIRKNSFTPTRSCL